LRPPDKASQTDEIRLLYVGYLRDTKGVKYLIDSMDYLPEQIELTVVGDGPEREALESQVEGSAAFDRIEFTGSIPYEEITRAYANADIFVHPGVWPEPFGRTILEAMQAGLPVVATDIGGPGETVPQTELLCPPREPKKLAESIKYAYNNQDEIGRENKQIAYEKYHPDTVVPQFLETYRQVIEEK